MEHELATLASASDALVRLLFAGAAIAVCISLGCSVLRAVTLIRGR